jgi:hypothetical protein
MTFRALAAPLALASLALISIGSGGCLSSRPVVDPSSGPSRQDGTLAGHVRTDTNVPLPGRIVRAVPVGATTEPYETTTSDTGAYTLKVRPGRYRLLVQLREGERLVKDPGETNVNASDLDPARDFVVSISPR